MKKVAILISGGGSNMVALCRSMTGDHPARPVLVISNKPDAGGVQKAEALGLETALVDHRSFETKADFETALAEALERAEADIICLAGFMRVLSADFVARFEGRLLNIHPSLLPKYKGLNTHARALEAGDVEAGCSVHEVIADLDAGPILGQARAAVDRGETVETLEQKVLQLEHNLYPKVLHRFATGNKQPIFLT